MSENDTLPKLLLEHARLRGDRPAYREKDLGIWQTWSWSETEKEIRNLSCGLKQLGFERGDKLAIIPDFKELIGLFLVFNHGKTDIRIVEDIFHLLSH